MTSETDIATLRAFMQREDRERRHRIATRVAELHRAAPELARLLRERFGADRVWLFGSLAWGEPDDQCDLDLAVEGLASRDYFTALGELLAIAPAPVDLVRMAEAPPELVARIEAEGVLLDG